MKDLHDLGESVNDVDHTLDALVNIVDRIVDRMAFYETAIEGLTTVSLELTGILREHKSRIEHLENAVKLLEWGG